MSYSDAFNAGFLARAADIAIFKVRGGASCTADNKWPDIITTAQRHVVIGLIIYFVPLIVKRIDFISVLINLKQMKYAQFHALPR
jgi:hypothetical protein